MDRYADGKTITSRRRQKADLLATALASLFPDRDGLRLLDFGCADGAVPAEILRGPQGDRIAKIVGITLLDYNDLPEKPAHAHPRFERLVADLEGDLASLALDEAAWDGVTATAFFPYLRRPEVALSHAVRLLRPGGFLLATIPARLVLRLRRTGFGGVCARNRRIVRIETLDEWRRRFHTAGLEEVGREPVQWLGLRAVAGLEARLRRAGALSRLATNHLVTYRKL